MRPEFTELLCVLYTRFLRVPIRECLHQEGLEDILAPTSLFSAHRTARENGTKKKDWRDTIVYAAAIELGIAFAGCFEGR